MYWDGYFSNRYHFILYFNGRQSGFTIPIIEHGHGHAAVKHAVEAAHYANPLTQILMLTAIVVGVATLGVGLALVQRVYSEYGKRRRR